MVNQLANTDEKVCDNATDKFLKAVGGTKEQCKKSAREDDGSTKPKVGKITVDGDKATAVLSADGSKATFTLVKDGDDWKLDSVRWVGSPAIHGRLSTSTDLSASAAKIARRFYVRNRESRRQAVPRREG